jgi:preprotein translocase YajC subunit
MPDDGNLLLWVIIIGGMLVILFLPQWLDRRRQRKREAELQIGDSVITVGGFIGDLTFFDPEANLARIRLAEGVEVRIVSGAIRGKRTTPPAARDEIEVDEPPRSEM